MKTSKSLEIKLNELIQIARGISDELNDNELNQSYVGFYEFINQLIAEKQSRPSKKKYACKMYEILLLHLKTYEKEKGLEIDYDTFDNRFRNEFENWLYAYPREHSRNYASKIFEVLKGSLREATSRGYNSNMAYIAKAWVVRKAKVQNIALSFEELQLLYDLDLSKNKRLERVRDSFLIGCYSGLRYSDFKRIIPQNIIEEDGVGYLQITTNKTNIKVIIPLFPKLKYLLKKNNNSSPRAISNQKMNIYLKELCNLAGLNELVQLRKNIGGENRDIIKEKYKFVSTHTARRSFATNFYELGFTAYELMQITGHASEQKFMTYININKKRNARNIVDKINRMDNSRILELI